MALRRISFCNQAKCLESPQGVSCIFFVLIKTHEDISCAVAWSELEWQCLMAMCAAFNLMQDGISVCRLLIKMAEAKRIDMSVCQKQ